MKKTISISGLRKVATVSVLLIATIFIGFSLYLWFTYQNVLSDKVIVSDDKILLTNFDTSKFDRAHARLEKRRNLKGPADGISDPFGEVSE